MASICCVCARSVCVCVSDVQCVCKEGYIGDGYTCTGNLLQVLRSQPRFSNFLAVSPFILCTEAVSKGCLNFSRYQYKINYFHKLYYWCAVWCARNVFGPMHSVTLQVTECVLSTETNFWTYTKANNSNLCFHWQNVFYNLTTHGMYQTKDLSFTSYL